MIEGRRIIQISKAPRNIDGTPSGGLIEVTHHVIKFRQYLPAGRLPDGTVRRAALIQFWADPGGLRTVRAADLIL